MTEKDIQNELFFWREKNGHKLIVPNCKVFGYEADLISVSKANLSYEHEIKCSIADFRREFRARSKKSKNQLRECRSPIYCPNYFFYVCAFNLIPLSEIPDYAGLIYVNTGEVKRFEIIKPAPRLHKRPLNENQSDYLSRGLMFRYWKLRRNIKENISESN